MAEGEATAMHDDAPRDRSLPLFRPEAPPDPAAPGSICRFLLRETSDGTLGAATGGVDPANRCTAILEPVPQSGRQQELVCLTAAHANCPRYLRGVAASELPTMPVRREPVSAAVIGASLVLTAALAASFGFLAVRGGFNIPLRTPTPAPIAAAATPTLAPVGSAPPSVSAVPSAPPSAIPSPGPSPTPSATPSPGPTPTSPPSVTPPPTPQKTPTPAPTSDRYAVLTRCPTQADCWIYVIRAGDNLTSIANWFGVSFDRMISMNPGLRRPIHAGDRLKIPTPTR